MAAFSSSLQQYHPFLLDPLILPSPNNNTTTSFEFSPFCCNSNAHPLEFRQPGPDEVLSRENDSSAAKKQSTTTTTTTESSSAATPTVTAAVSNRRRKTRNGSFNSKEERGGGKSKRQKKGGEEKAKKPSEEPPKDYIHVRARRGQATDSHSLAERVRREKISERMRILQKLVPGCDKVTGKALMLDEIINYVQSLQNQVEFLSMKLASMSPVVYDFGVDLDAFMVRPEMGSTGGGAAFTEGMPTTAPPFPPLLDNSLLHPHLPISQGNLNDDEDQRQKYLNQSGFTNNSFCSFP